MAMTTRCARCGRPVDEGVFLCEQCREEEGVPVAAPTRPVSPLEERASRWPPSMPRPSPVQYHATVMVTVVLVLAGLAIFAFLNRHGVGPFRGNATRIVRTDATTIRVEATVENLGSKTARANCRVYPVVGNQPQKPADQVLTRPIGSHASVRFTHVLRGVDFVPTGVRVDCS